MLAMGETAWPLVDHANPRGRGHAPTPNAPGSSRLGLIRTDRAAGMPEEWAAIAPRSELLPAVAVAPGQGGSQMSRENPAAPAQLVAATCGFGLLTFPHRPGYRPN